ncbi:MAG TPA: energy transducer TonB [Vicinamibacterales bacterium]|nr:energy transducer TonB [Vicinamibacterales bacterium]
MTPASLRAAAVVVRIWTRLYTWRLPADIRARRVEDVESDLWESQRAGTTAIQIAARLVLGIPDDLGWRIDMERAMKRALFPAISVAACIVAMVILVRVVAVLSAAPPPPESPRVTAARRAAVRPPPPPPPPRPGPGDDAPFVGVYRLIEAGESPWLANGVRSPYWPVDASLRLEDSVVVRATLQPDNTVTDLRIVQSIPKFDRQVLDVIRKRAYTATTLNGHPVATKIELIAPLTGRRLR